MNKAELIDALAERIGDRKTAAAAVEGIVDVVVRTVHKGDKVTITGFGVFERRARSARTARNPRTGETVKVKKTNVPAFRAGTTFKDVVSGAKKLPRAVAAAPTRAANGRGTSARAATKAGRSTSTPELAMDSEIEAKATAAKAAKTATAETGATVGASESGAVKTRATRGSKGGKASKATTESTTEAAATQTAAAKTAAKAGGDSGGGAKASKATGKAPKKAAAKK